MSVSVWLPRPATQLLLHLLSHNTNKVHTLHDASCKTEPNFVNWYLDRAHRSTKPTLILFSYKNWFHLGGYVKSLTVTGTGLHINPCTSIQCFVWHATSTNVSSTTESILFSETIDSPQFLNTCQITKELTCLFWARQWNSKQSTFPAPEYKLNIHCNIQNYNVRTVTHSTVQQQWAIACCQCCPHNGPSKEQCVGQITKCPCMLSHLMELTSRTQVIFLIHHAKKQDGYLTSAHKLEHVWYGYDIQRTVHCDIFL